MLEVHGLMVRRGGLRLRVDHLKVGERGVLLGRNGSGKSTLLRCLAGFIKPSKGTILLDGRDITNLHPSLRSIGYIPQEPVRLPLKPADAIKYFEEKFGVDGSEIVERLGMGGLLHKSSLSTGESQIINLAIVLMRGPRLLLLDEPTANLDFLNKVNYWRILKDLSTPMVYVTHDPIEAAVVGDMIYIMDNGYVQGPHQNPLGLKVEDLLEDFNLYRRMRV